MPEPAERWPAVPDWAGALLHLGDTTVATVTGLGQMLVSGDLAAWSRASGIAETGDDGKSVATGDRYAVRLARDRLLGVSAAPFDIAAGWHDEGFAVSTVDTGLHVFEIAGPQASGILARATTLDPNGATASAAVLFAGVNAVVYPYRSAERIRIHVDCGLAPYLWQWLAQVCS